MKQLVAIIPCLLGALAACGTREEDSAADDAVRAARPRVVVLATDYTTGVLDALNPRNRSQVARRLLVTAADAVLKRLGDSLVVVNRGYASNLVVLDARLSPTLQVSLPGCGPHDLALLADGRALVTCYEAAGMRVVDLATGAVQDGPDLSPLADADGIPEADHVARRGDRMYVTLQLLDRANIFSPTGNGLLAVIDAQTLALVDVDAERAGTQAHDLGCTSPYTSIEAAPDGRFVVACSGAFKPGSAALVAIDPLSGAVERLADEAVMGGPPSALRLDASGVPHVLVSYPSASDVSEMRLVRLGGGAAGSADVLYASADFTLAGLAIDDDGTTWVGNRSVGADSGVWAVGAQTGTSGPVATTLPPFDLEVF